MDNDLLLTNERLAKNRLLYLKRLGILTPEEYDAALAKLPETIRVALEEELNPPNHNEQE